MPLFYCRNDGTSQVSLGREMKLNHRCAGLKWKNNEILLLFWLYVFGFSRMDICQMNRSTGKEGEN